MAQGAGLSLGLASSLYSLGRRIGSLPAEILPPSLAKGIHRHHLRMVYDHIEVGYGYTSPGQSPLSGRLVTHFRFSLGQTVYNSREVFSFPEGDTVYFGPGQHIHLLTKLSDLSLVQECLHSHRVLLGESTVHIHLGVQVLPYPCYSLPTDCLLLRSDGHIFDALGV